MLSKMPKSRRNRLTRQIEELMPSWSMAPVAAALQAMRGVALVVAVTVVAEVGDFRRFTNARQLMAYLGLVPSEHSSGSTVRRAGITKAGNALARRVLIEGAWTYRMSVRVSGNFTIASSHYPRRSGTSPGKRRSGCARDIGASLQSVSRRSWSPPRSPARWSASSGRSPALHSLSSSDQATETEPTKKEVGKNPRCTLLEAGPRWGTLVTVMSRSPDRCSTLERGSPETEPWSCGTQSAHESLFNRRLRVLSPAVRTNDRRSPRRRSKKLRAAP